MGGIGQAWLLEVVGMKHRAMFFCVGGLVWVLLTSGPSGELGSGPLALSLALCHRPW